MPTFDELNDPSVGLFFIHSSLKSRVEASLRLLMTEPKFDDLIQSWYRDQFLQHNHRIIITATSEEITGFTGLIANPQIVGQNAIFIGTKYASDPNKYAPNLLLSSNNKLQGKTFEGSFDRFLAHEMVHLLSATSQAYPKGQPDLIDPNTNNVILTEGDPYLEVQMKDIVLSNNQPSKNEQDEANIVAGLGSDLNTQRAETVVLTNRIMKELTGETLRGVYAFREDLGPDIELTGGEIIERAIAGATGAREEAVTYAFINDDLSDLIWAGGGDDNIIAGGGNDFIYGGTGDDRILPGSGDDFIHGGGIPIDPANPASFNSPSVLLTDGTDSVEYELIDGEFSKAGINIILGDPDTQVDLQNTGIQTGENGWITVEDGTGGVDYLLSIEKIIGTDHADSASLLDFFDAQLKTLKFIDGGENKPEDGSDAAGDLF